MIYTERNTNGGRIVWKALKKERAVEKVCEAEKWVGKKCRIMTGRFVKLITCARDSFVLWQRGTLRNDDFDLFYHERFLLLDVSSCLRL